MTRRTSEEIELNFDGLTDSLTNLVGTLILIVFLMLVITHEIQLKPPPPSPATKLWQEAGQTRSATQLLRGITQLQAELQLLDDEVARQETALPQLQRRVLKLQERRGGAPTEKQSRWPTRIEHPLALGDIR